MARYRPSEGNQKLKAIIAALLAKHYSRKLRGTVWSVWDDEERAFEIRGEGLPANPDLVEQYPNGWSTMDHVQFSAALDIAVQEATL